MQNTTFAATSTTVSLLIQDKFLKWGWKYTLSVLVSKLLKVSVGLPGAPLALQANWRTERTH